MKGSLKNTKNEWETLARLDPLWAILSEKNKRFGKWNEIDFFATGEKEISSVISYLREKGIFLKKINKVLDFGCGVGRLTRALAKYFPSVYGLDISETMIKKAKKLNAKYKNCHFLVNRRGSSLSFRDNYFDFIYSDIVLQHFPNKKTMLKQISEFIRILRPSGIALFQLPSKLPFLVKLHPRRRLYNFLKNLGFNKKFLYNKLGLYGFSMLNLSTPKIKNVLKNKVKVIEIKNEGKIDTSYLIKKLPKGSR